MLASGNAIGTDRVKEILGKHAWPKDLRLKSIRFMEDQTGDPAVRIEFSVPKRLKYASGVLNGWTAFFHSMRREVYQETERIAYFSLAERNGTGG